MFLPVSLRKPPRSIALLQLFMLLLNEAYDYFLWKTWYLRNFHNAFNCASAEIMHSKILLGESQESRGPENMKYLRSFQYWPIKNV